jgi:hypothetical protein
MRRLLVVSICSVLVLGVSLAGSAKEKLADPAALKRKTSDARKRVAKAKGMLVQGFGILQDARSSGDTSRVQCVNSALTQMKGLMRLADNSMLELEEAESQANGQAVERNAVKINVATGKVADANRRLKACMGSEESGVTTGGGPVVLVEADSNLPNVDPTEGLKDLPPQLENTVSASPFFE